MKVPRKAPAGFLLVLLAFTALGIGFSYARLQQAQANPGPTMGVDPDRGGAQPVGGTKALAVGLSTQIGFHVTALDGVSYQAYQVRLQYDDVKLDMINIPGSWASNNTWP